MNLVVNRNTGCWIWPGRRDSYNYGRLFYNGLDIVRLHRTYYKELINPNLSKDIILHHICKNRLCLNPNHLQELTISEHSKLHNTKNIENKQLCDIYLYGFTLEETANLFKITARTVADRLAKSGVRRRKIRGGRKSINKSI